MENVDINMQLALVSTNNYFENWNSPCQNPMP